MTEMIGHIAETAGHDEPKTRSVTMDRNPRSRCRNHRSRWSEIRTSGLDCLLLDQLALADGLLAPAPGLPAVPSTHHAPVGLVQHGWVLHRALFQARAPPAALRA